MRHNELYVKEFQIQLKELCDLNLIRPSKSPHSSPVFKVRNRNEINRNKARMVVNYKCDAPIPGGPLTTRQSVETLVNVG